MKNYGDSNWKDKVTAIGGKAITYDAIGNPLTYDGWTFTWKAGRMLASMVKTGTNAQFTYDHNGLRIKKVVNGVTTNYTLNDNNIVHMMQGSHDLHFFYDAQGKPGMVTYNDVDYFYVYNLQGDVVALIDANGTQVVEYVYDAWGNPISKTGTLAATLGTLNPFRYRGYVYDEETGLYYLRSRYYNPIIRKYLNADILLGKQLPLQHNTYSYCVNSPITKVDEDGCASTSSLWTTLLTRIQNTLAITLHTQQAIESPNSKKPTVTVSALMNNLQYLVDRKTDVSADKDTGCAMFIRAGILGKKGRHSHKTYYAGMTPMFENNMVFWGKISDIGGTLGLIPGMILGEHQDKKKFVSHGGVYYGLHDFGKGPEPAVYSFDTKHKKGHLHPYSDNDWVYYGWHEGVIFD